MNVMMPAPSTPTAHRTTTGTGTPQQQGTKSSTYCRATSWLIYKKISHLQDILFMRRSKERTRKNSLLLPYLSQGHYLSSEVENSSFPRNQDNSSFIFSKTKQIRTLITPNDLFQKRASKKRNESKYIPSESTNLVIKTFGLTPRQLTRLRRKFRRIDIDNSGMISRHDFFTVLDEPQTPVTDAFFKLLYYEDKGKIDFDAFLKVCFTYCIYSRKDILKFCFDCFDTDSSGFIDENEYKKMCEAVHNGSPTFPGNFDQALDMFDENGDGVIDFIEFVALDRRFPILMFPAFRLQKKMQHLTLGEKTWMKINEKIEICRYRQDFMNAHNGVEPPKSFVRTVILPSLKITLPQTQYLSPDEIDEMKRIRKSSAVT